MLLKNVTYSEYYYLIRDVTYRAEREKLRNTSFISRLSTRRKDRITASSTTLMQSSPSQQHVMQRASSAVTVPTDDSAASDHNGYIVLSSLIMFLFYFVDVRCQFVYRSCMLNF